MENNNSHYQSLIEKYNCLSLYSKIVECVKEHEKHDTINKNICKEEFINLGECIINGQKKEEQNFEIANQNK
jgi:hypothetical protein